MTLSDNPSSHPRRFPLFSSVRTLLGRIVWKSYVLGLVASVILGGGIYMVTRNGTATQAATGSVETVERRTITAAVKATGEVTFANEQQLRFNQKGKVAQVSVREGDRVKKGQLIAQLDASTVQADIRQAQLSLSASALQLKQLQNDKQKTLTDAENALRVSQEKLPADLAAAERAVREKEAALEQAQAALEQAKATGLQDLGSTAQTILSQSEDLLDTLYGTLVNDTAARRATGVKTLEIHYRLYNDVSQKNETERSYFAAVEALESMRLTYGKTLPALRDAASLAPALSQARAAAAAVKKLADDTYVLLQGAASDPVTLTVSDINTLKQTAVSSRTSAATQVDDAETALASLTGGEDGLTSITIKQKQDAVSTAQSALQTARENLRVLQTQTPGDLQSKQQALDAARTTTDVNVALKQNDIAQKSTSLQKTTKALEDYRLTAPFDGVIRRLDYQTGDNLLDTGEDKMVVLENPDFLVVTVLLDQVDIVRVRKDMAARITLDALPGREFQGAMDEINPTPVESSGVVSYEVAIRLPAPKDLTILSGMTATVSMETMRRENVLAVPNLALQRINGQATVQLADGGTVTVTTGATDGKYTEILSGLQEGDSVVSMNVPAAQAQGNTTANPAQLFRLGGGGGGGAVFQGGGTRGAGGGVRPGGGG